MSDAVKTISQNTARYAGGEYVKARYYDSITPTPDTTEKAEEIIERIKGKLRGGAGS